MKSYKVITIISIILLIAVIVAASFFGIYRKNEYSVKDIVPDYLFGVEFSNSRVLNMEVDDSIESTTIYDKDGNEVTEQEEGVEYTEENGYTTVENKVNSEDKLTKENYEKTKEILVNRLISLGAEEYTIKQDTNSGKIQIRMTENANTDIIIEDLNKKGTFEIRDSETDEILLDTSNVESVSVASGQSDTEIGIYLQIKLNKDGKQKLEEISKTYVETTTETTDENGETSEETTTKEVDILFDGEQYSTTYFGEPMTTGVLDIRIGTSSNEETLQEYVTQASRMAIILNTGELPIVYETTSYTESANITDTQIYIAMCIGIAIVCIMFIYLIIKLKSKGILAFILQIGYIGLLFLVLRYTNIKITLEGVVGILTSIIINYIYIYKIFNNLGADFIKETTLKISIKLIPIYIIAVVFTFNSISNISSLGMTLVWGVIIMYLYNLTLTHIVAKTIQDK